MLDVGDFEILHGLAEALGRRFRGMRRAIEVCAVQNCSFDLTEEEEAELDAQWEAIVRKAAGSGGEVIQVQVCETPLEDDMIEYLRYAGAQFGALGERLLVVSDEDFRRMSGGWDMTRQFWSVDGRFAIVSSFTKEGRLLGNDEVTDRRESEEIARLAERALSLALPPEEFIDRLG